MNIMFDIIRNNHPEIEIISGWLSDADFYNGNWKISIPFYLRLQENSFLIKEKLKMRYVYPKYKNYEDFSKTYAPFNNYDDFIKDISDGHIIYLLIT